MNVALGKNGGKIRSKVKGTGTVIKPHLLLISQFLLYSNHFDFLAVFQLH